MRHHTAAIHFRLLLFFSIGFPSRTGRSPRRKQRRRYPYLETTCRPVAWLAVPRPSLAAWLRSSRGWAKAVDYLALPGKQGLEDRKVQRDQNSSSMMPLRSLVATGYDWLCMVDSHAQPPAGM